MRDGRSRAGRPAGEAGTGVSGIRLVLAFCVAEVVSMTGFGLFPGLLPTFLEEWRLSNTEAGWINGIYFGAYALAVPVLVSLTDRVDPRRVYLLGSVLTAASSVGFGWLAQGFWSGLAWRALAGVGLAGTYMPGLKALTDHLGDRVESRAVAFYTATFSIGASLSLVLAGELAAWLDWRATFVLAGLGPLLAGLAIWWATPPSAPHHLSAPRTFLLDFRPVLRNRRALGYVLAYSAHNWELFALRSWLVTFLVFAQAQQPAGSVGLGWSATWLAGLVTLLGLPASVLGNEASVRFGRRRVVTAVMLVSAVTACLVAAAPLGSFVLAVGLCLLYGVTVSADSASITAGAVAAAAAGQRGATMAVHSFIGFAGAFAGPLAFGVVLDLGGGGDSMLAWLLAFASSGLAVSLGPLALAVLVGKQGEQW